MDNNISKTKIIATIGPSSSSKEVIVKMANAGLDVCRLNFSHGSYVDHLKVINDTWGHAQGDLALVETAAVLKETFREADIPARFGGDEFVVLAVDVALESAATLVKRLQSALERHNQSAGRPWQLSISLGIASYDSAAPCTLSELISKADALMYTQKQTRQGRG